MREVGWQLDEEVNRDKTGEADGKNLEVDSKDELMLWIGEVVSHYSLGSGFFWDTMYVSFPVAVGLVDVLKFVYDLRITGAVLTVHGLATRLYRVVRCMLWL